MSVAHKIKKQLYSTKFLSTGSAFPQTRVSNNDLAAKIETSDEWIIERTGIQARHISKTADETNSGLAFQASLAALEKAGVSAQEIDLILYATVSPDQIMPNTACILQNKLKAYQAAALDISAACSGFVYGLSIANAFIQTGQYSKILLVGSEVLSSMVDWQDRSTCILFGDGAGVALLGRAEEHEQSRIYSTHLHADGSLQDLFHVPAGGSSMPLSQEVLEKRLQFMQMKGKEIFKVAVRMLCDGAMEELELNGFTVKDVDWIIPHQANLRIIEAVAKRLDFPMEKVILNIAEYGNTSAATVPTALDEAVRSGKIQRNQLILMNVFGAGLTYGSALLRW